MTEYYDSAFKPSRFTLWITGLRPFKNHIKPTVYCLVAAEALCNSLTIISLLYDKTFLDIVDIVVSQIYNFNAVIRVATLMYYEKEFQNMFQDLEKLWPITNPESHTVLKYLRYFETVMLALLFGFLAAIITHSSITGERFLHFYRPELVPETFFVYFVIDGVLVLTACIWLGFDTLFLTITIILIVQYRMFNEASQSCYMSNEQQNKNLIKTCIEQSNLLKRITDRMNRIFGFMLLIYIWLIVVILGLLLYILYERNGDSLIFLKYFIILSCLITVMFVCYVTPAQLLTNEINKMFDSIYCTKWYECSLSVQQLLLTILAKRKTDAAIAAFGKLVEINFRTCTSMFRTCFSVFTFMIHMQNNPRSNTN